VTEAALDEGIAPGPGQRRQPQQRQVADHNQGPDPFGTECTKGTIKKGDNVTVNIELPRV